MPTSTRATPVSSSTSEAERECEYQESEKSDEEYTQKQGRSIAKLELQQKNWSLHFDGIDDHEYQVLVLKNEWIGDMLEAFQLPKGKADTVVKGTTAVLDEYKLWNCVKMIVADTNVNTGKRHGIVIQLLRLFAQKG
ncbi:Hypothetical predicted protein [Octopus vulgaris]|uniref:Uncharacterized protein n=1 Tax=Octopus vulgaris TaxID=6645 RepID=A0AA36F509_OCTVU|nr:Hypothetical predicted protein [Octopus vulgaris]